VVVQHLEDQLPAAYASVCRYDLQNETLTILARSRKSEQLLASRGAPEGVPFPYSTGGILRLQASADGLYLPDMGGSEEPGVQELYRVGLRALIAVPLKAENEMLGLFMVARTEVDAFSNEEFEFLKTLGEHVSLAAHQARLYEQLQKAYDELRDTQQIVLQQERLRALGQMASGIAHDINNALSPIVGYTDLLLAFDTKLTEAAKEGLKAIRLAGQDIAHTVANMREFYRKREQQEPPSPINLNRLIEQVIDLTRPRWRDIPQEHGIVIEVQTDFHEDLPSFEGNETEIRQALTNLILNAVDAMPQGGTIRFQTSLAGVNPVLAVTDTGTGMDSETRSRCLEPFFTTKGDRGTGLGLAMVSGAMQRHDGCVEIQSEVGRGTTVRLVFAAGRSSKEDMVDPGAAVPPSPMRILCIDDELLQREVMKQILVRDNHVVEVADGGQAGLDAFHAASLQSEPFDVVISDLGMPYVDGREVARLVKQESPATPVILLTGWGERIRAEGSLPADVDFVISKPTTVKQLRETLHRANGKARSPAGCQMQS
jgi:signal transduction histidine kinase/ActR/RegA family two-component response regulator